MSHACIGCGRSPGKYSREVELSGRRIYQSPGQWIYALRNGDTIGLCDQCFERQRFSGLTEAEIAYFREQFGASADHNDSA